MGIVCLACLRNEMTHKNSLSLSLSNHYSQQHYRSHSCALFCAGDLENNPKIPIFVKKATARIICFLLDSGAMTSSGSEAVCPSKLNILISDCTF